MKRILFFSLVSMQLFGNTVEHHDDRFAGFFSAGYVIKNDCRFKQVYGRGIANIITADGCYNFRKVWGFGAKLSYWRAKGCTSFLSQRTHLHQVPVTAYFRRIKNFDSGLKLYGSLGGGLVWTKEKSYICNESFTKGVGEVEAGFYYPFWRIVTIGAAVRYLFPPQSQNDERIDVGGIDLRAGIGFEF